MWTEEQEGKLRALLGEGKTFSECAIQLPGRSRSACIGKAHRLGIASSSVPKPAKPRVRPEPKPRVRPEPKPRPPRSVASKVRASRAPPRSFRRKGVDDGHAVSGRGTFADLRNGECRKTFADLRDGECRDLDEDGTYCAAPCEGRGSYCPHHARLVYRPRKPDGQERASA